MPTSGLFLRMLQILYYNLKKFFFTLQEKIFVRKKFFLRTKKCTTYYYNNQIEMKENDSLKS